MSTIYLPRSAWTSTSPGGAVLSGDRLEGVACHYPGDGNVTYRDLTEAQVAAKLRAYRDYHVNTRGWSDIGYSVAGDQSGRVWDLRGIGRVPAAQASETNPDANHEWGAFLWVVGNREQPTAALIEAFLHWRRTRWLARYPHADKIVGHQQVPGASTDCPGDQVMALIRSGFNQQEEDMALTTDEIEAIARRVVGIPVGSTGLSLGGFAQQHSAALAALLGRDPVDVDEAELAAVLAPLLTPQLQVTVGDLSDAALTEIAGVFTAAAPALAGVFNDELARRQAS